MVALTFQCLRRKVLLGLPGLLALLAALLLTTPTHGAGGSITFDPTEGDIGNVIIISGSGFTANRYCHIYFSSIETVPGANINTKINIYQHVTVARTNDSGNFSGKFTIPDRLADGAFQEDVHGGQYYVYLTYYGSTDTVFVAKFTVKGSEIEVDPEESQVGSPVQISGQHFRPNQPITVKYDDKAIAITGGDQTTDSKGQFTSTVTIPESTAGTHTITASDVSGNQAEAEFSVKAKITLEPGSAAAGSKVTVSGSGFHYGDEEYITVTINSEKTLTTPVSVTVQADGSFSASIIAPYPPAGGTSLVTATDTQGNRAEASLSTSVTASLRLSPATSPAAPAYIGMAFTVDGSSFKRGGIITITYDGETRLGTATADALGNFSVTFAVPASPAGDHTVTVSDGTDSLSAGLVVEATPPPMSLPLAPKDATPAGAEILFDWEDVTDPSGLTYTLQVSTARDFSTALIEKTGLSDAAYRLSGEERQLLSDTTASYYWRVRAVDGAGNEGNWTFPMLFYFGSSPPAPAAPANPVPPPEAGTEIPLSAPYLLLYISIGFGAAGLIVIVWWIRRSLSG